MSRVEEALRRAAAQARETGRNVAGAPVGAEVTLRDVGEFPEEGEPAADASTALEPGPRGAEPELDAVQEDPAPSEPDWLLTHVDAQFAEKVVIDEGITPMAREQYRKLAAGLHDRQTTGGLKVVLIVSATAGEGKTLTSANLAMTLSESYRDRVLLVDGDLRRPALHRLFGLPAVSGLSEGLATSNGQKLPIRRLSERLTVLPAGRPNPDPMAGLKSERMREILEEARERFDWVIIDTPPLVFLPDAHLLARLSDGVVLVVRAECTAYPLVQRGIDAVGKDRILGVVLNGATAEAFSDYGHHYYDQYYASGKEPPR